MNAQRIVESCARPMIYRDKVIKDGIQICPHCNAEVHEKGMALREGRWVHGACGGEIQSRPLNAEEQAFLARLRGNTVESLPKFPWLAVPKARHPGHYRVVTKAPVDLPDGRYESLQYGYVIEIDGREFPTSTGLRQTRDSALMSGPKETIVYDGQIEVKA